MDNERESSLSHDTAPSAHVIDAEWELQEDPEAVAQTLQRPVYEPPVINFMPLFEDEDANKELQLVKDEYGVEIGTAMIDNWTERFILESYLRWGIECGHGAVDRNDAEKEKYYEGLCHAVREDLIAGMDDTIDSTIPEVVREKLKQEPFKFRDSEGSRIDPWAYIWDCLWNHRPSDCSSVGSTSSRPPRPLSVILTPRRMRFPRDDDRSPHSIDFDASPNATSTEYLSAVSDASTEDLIDLSPSPTDGSQTIPGDISSILRSTGIVEMSEVDRLLDL